MTLCQEVISQPRHQSTNHEEKRVKFDYVIIRNIHTLGDALNNTKQKQKQITERKRYWPKNQYTKYINNSNKSINARTIGQKIQTTMQRKKNRNCNEKGKQYFGCIRLIYYIHI